MRSREAILAVALAVTLAACTGDSDDSDPSPTEARLSEITIECAEFADTAEKITDAQTALYSDTGSTGAIDTLAAELTALQADAPPEIQTALTGMLAAFRDAEEILESPTQENKARLVELAPKLSADGQKITAYIPSQCG